MKEHYVSMNLLGNRIPRHMKYGGKTLAVKIDGIWIGLTHCDITPVKYSRNFNQAMTPYTENGRITYAKMVEQTPLLCRPAIYKADDLFQAHQGFNRKMCNFEFYMNRDYAYNRDRGKCKACGCYLYGTNPQCHHINPSLPLNQVNKVKNLASLCPTCHALVHNNQVVEGKPKQVQKIEMFREIYAKAKAEHEKRN